MRMNSLRWFSSASGRVVQVLVGLGLVAFGVSSRNSWLSAALFVVVGLFPLVGGLFDLNFLSALWGGPLRGDEVRETEENPV